MKQKQQQRLSLYEKLCADRDYYKGFSTKKWSKYYAINPDEICKQLQIAIDKLTPILFPQTKEQKQQSCQKKQHNQKANY